MATVKISVTVDADVLAEVRRRAGSEKALSSIVAEALEDEMYRQRALEWLAELEREFPISESERKAGAQLWHDTVSSSIPAPSPPRAKNRKSTRGSERRSRRA